LNITAAIERRSRGFVVFCTIALFCAAVMFRYLVPPQFSVSFLFLLPISFATWFLSWRAGSIVAALGTILLLYFDLDFAHLGRAGAYWNAFINAVVAGTFIYIFSELQALYRRQIDLSRRDPLTGLLNRCAFRELLTIETKRIARHRRPITLAYIDLDNFKSINDQYGHTAGDQLLVAVGQQIARRLRATDSLARLGGDELGILLPETDEAAARLVLNDVRKSLMLYGAVEHGHDVTFSVGAVTFTSADFSPASMIAMADEAMYTVKKAGKNNVKYKLAG
jgi:diguanylate cyclase (GGDEF)-like protein